MWGARRRCSFMRRIGSGGNRFEDLTRRTLRAQRGEEEPDEITSLEPIADCQGRGGSEFMLEPGRRPADDQDVLEKVEKWQSGEPERGTDECRQARRKTGGRT